MTLTTPELVEPLYDLINRPGTGWVLFPIAIRADLTVNVHMPTDLTKAEAEKIARVVLAYASPTGSSSHDR